MFTDICSPNHMTPHTENYNKSLQISYWKVEKLLTGFASYFTYSTKTFKVNKYKQNLNI